MSRVGPSLIASAKRLHFCHRAKLSHVINNSKSLFYGRSSCQASLLVVFDQLFFVGIGGKFASAVGQQKAAALEALS